MRTHTKLAAAAFESTTPCASASRALRWAQAWLEALSALTTGPNSKCGSLKAKATSKEDSVATTKDTLVTAGGGG
eukprot:CAMPEP_0171781178 /NCGR_PEP_ID=MMETSP0991-20121206/60063_1 /TAXON_ID=483369 /ORGANISM="non described non described, Strain CCMP2098" /LENGTH=74 /DNA_ID=CAMNT_0012388715 /DNA_START=76 /DNA_END=296 /DNA_ORIENTATION=-